jgi:PilZ domain-containing protein
MPDDRQSPRKVVKTSLSIQIEPNNTATVLNVSDGGLGFCASRPVIQSGKVHFSFLENDLLVASSGVLVWTDPSKLTGGLSFASLPQPERERIYRWLNQAAAPKIAPAVSKPAPLPLNEPAPAPLKESPPLDTAPPRANAAPSPPFPPTSIPMQQLANPGFQRFEDVPQPRGYAWDREMAPLNSRPKFFRGFLAGVIVSAIIAGFLFFTYGNSNIDLRKQWSELIGVSPALRAAPPAPSPVQAPPPAPLELPPTSSVGGAPSDIGPLPAPGDAPKADSTPANTTTESPIENERNTPVRESLPSKTADLGEEDLAIAQRNLAEMPRHTSSATAAQYLWAAVEKGNVTAEITLADLYARGDGVTKSCAQAQMLLRAAAKRGSSEASEKLAQMIRIGCR